jgi:hypothetical protein
MKLSCHVSLKDGDLALAQGRWSRETYESVVLEGTPEVSCSERYGQVGRVTVSPHSIVLCA